VRDLDNQQHYKGSNSRIKSSKSRKTKREKQWSMIDHDMVDDLNMT